MEIALDALEMADAVDVVVLVTGDGDSPAWSRSSRSWPSRRGVLLPRTPPRSCVKRPQVVPIDKRMLIKMSRVAPRPTPTARAGADRACSRASVRGVDEGLGPSDRSADSDARISSRGARSPAGAGLAGQVQTRSM